MLFLGFCFSCVFSQQKVHENYLDETFPGLTAKRFAKGIISTKDYEHGSPAFSPFYDEIYWGIREKSEIGREIIKYVRKEKNSR